LKETLFFSTDAQTGSVATPHPFQMPLATPVEEAAPQAAARFDIMPNPFAGETLLRFDAERAGQARVSVLDVLGSVKGYWDVSVSAGANDYRWDGSAGAGRLPVGIYLLRLEVDGRAMTRKVVVQ
ncbi:MAG: T9SS type A sorting domain-containing protein, partial [Haliscomenobacter sp.]